MGQAAHSKLYVTSHVCAVKSMWPSVPAKQCVVNSVKMASNILIIYIYMVQYAEIQHFYQKSGKNENFYFPVIFKVIHVMTSYISQTVHRTIKVVTSISSIPADF